MTREEIYKLAEEYGKPFHGDVKGLAIADFSNGYIQGRNEVIDEIKEIILGFQTGLLDEDYEGKTLGQIISSLKLT